MDLTTIAGTGPAGRITAADVEGAKNGVPAAPPGQFQSAVDFLNLDQRGGLFLQCSHPHEQILRPRGLSLAQTSVVFERL